MLGILKKNIVYLSTFRKYSYLLALLVRRDIKKKYKGSFLGVLWSLLSPLLQIIILTIIFSTLFSTRIGNFPLYALTGRLVFEFFAAATGSSMQSIIESSDLLKKIYMPKYIMTLSRVLSNFIIFVISLFDLLLIMVITKANFTINMLYLPIYLVLLLIFVSGISLILATIATFFRDIVHLYGVFIMMLMFFSAIFYPVDIIPTHYQFFLEFNLVYQFIEGFRQIVYIGSPPEIDNLLICFFISITSFLIGILIFKKNQDKFISYI